MENQLENEELRQARWAQRKAEMKREKKKQEFFRKAFKIGIVLIAVAIVSLTAIRIKDVGKHKGTTENDSRHDNSQDFVVKAQTEPIQSETETLENITEENYEDNHIKTQETQEIQDTKIQNEKTKDNNALSQSMHTISMLVKIPKPAGVMDNINVQNKTYQYTAAENMVALGNEVVSNNAILVDIESGMILAGKDEKSRIVPASMTKVLTLLVAVEHMGNLDDTFQITGEILDYCFVNDCSGVGFEKGESVTVKDLLYGTVLPSGADAALGLAYYVAGSQEEFVTLMNQKLDELGLSETAHFTNCVGIYDADHYCTLYDLAVIMRAAIENPLCHEVLSAHTYTTSITEQHPEGLLISNWFLRRIEDKEWDGEVLCGKTGYVKESGNCAVSYGVSENGGKYICVTVNAYDRWKCISDHANLYKRFSESRGSI